MLKLFVAVIHATSVMAVVAYLLVRTSFYNSLMSAKVSILSKVWISLIFGAFSIYAALTALPVAGGLLALAHTGQMVAGLLFGPVTGLAASLPAALYRLSLGGTLVVPSTITVLLAGLLSGAYYLWRGKKRIGPWEAFFFTISYQILARIISLVMSPDFSHAWAVQSAIALPTILGHAIAVGIFILIINSLIVEKETRSEKERMAGELNLARNIQMSLVPKTFPPFPKATAFDLFAVLEPAREVGGDLYDFFLIDDRHFCIVIGDVSGKGVPAALFMSTTRALIKANTNQCSDPGIILSGVNNELCLGNDSSMFVTLFLGVLDIQTGVVTYSNAGHNPPYLYQSNGALESIKNVKGVVLGAMEDMPYASRTFDMAPGDSLVMYTDGVSEAMNPAMELFSEKRLEESILRVDSRQPADIIEALMNDVKSFADGAEQSDDITLMVLTFKGTEPSKESQ